MQQSFCPRPGLASRDLLIGLDDFVMGWRDQAEIYRADDRAVIENGESRVNYEEPQTTPDGQQIWLRTSKLPLRDVDGTIIGVLGTYEDITQEKLRAERERQLQAQVQHAQKLESLGVLAGGIAHDFNNLLTGILGNADLALVDLPAASRRCAKIEEIKHAATAAADLAARCSPTRARAVRGRALDLRNRVEEMGDMLEVSISKKAILRFDLADDLPAVEADATQIRQVVMNLIINASEAIGDERRHRRCPSASWTATRSTLERPLRPRPPAGQPMSPWKSPTPAAGWTGDAVTRIFDPFFTTKFTGRGLGLAAVLGIVRGHRGAIKVDSEPGGGRRSRCCCPPALFPPNLVRNRRVRDDVGKEPARFSLSTTNPSFGRSRRACSRGLGSRSSPPKTAGRGWLCLTNTPMRSTV